MKYNDCECKLKTFNFHHRVVETSYVFTFGTVANNFNFHHRVVETRIYNN